MRKKKIMARLLGAQRALATNPNTFLINLQDQLTNEYNEILQLEEELWVMKSRVNWTIFGERNTSFFHMTTLARRSRNIISSIMNDEGFGFMMWSKFKRFLPKFCQTLPN